MSHLHVSKLAFAILILFLGLSGSAEGQLLVTPGPNRQCDSVAVQDIIIAGNRTTRRPIITRELGFDKQSRIAITDTAALLAGARNRLLNTRLFVTVSLRLVPSSADTGICPVPVIALLEFKERWYIFALPILELSDRSINEWIYNQGADIRRINYGARVEHINMRGRAEMLKLVLQGGFTRKLELAYIIPYISQKQRQGLSLNLYHDSNRSISVASEGNKQKFIRDAGKNIIYRYRAGLGTSFRSGFYSYHNLSGNFFHSRVSDTVVRENPNYFYGGLNRQNYFSLHYHYTLDRRDIRQYPLHGGYIRTGVDQYIFTSPGYLTSVSADMGKFFDLGHQFYSAHGLSGVISSPKNQPYSVSRFLGFQQRFVRGYEKYVLEGFANAVVKNTLRYRLFQTQQYLRYMPIPQFRTIPIALYLKGYVDAGYVRNPFALPENRRLLNTLLVGFGGGLDLVTYYDFVLRLEYSANRQGEHGFFMQVAVEI